MMKRRFDIKTLIAGSIIGGLLTTGVGYAASHLVTIEVSMNPVQFVYNGEPLELEEDKPSFIYDGSTYVPLRWLSESLGKTVEWDEEKRIIYITDQDTMVEGQVGEQPGQDGEVKPDEDEGENVAIQLVLDKEVYSANDVLEFQIINGGSEAISFGRPFGLEYLKDGKFVEYPMDLAFTMELLILGEQETFTQSVDLGQIGLKEGTYRLIKTIHDLETGAPTQLSATFEVVESSK